MRDIVLQCAGLAGIAVALIHGVLGETKVFARATIQPESLRTLIRLVWQAGTVAWIGGAVLLIAAPSMGSESARHWSVATAHLNYLNPFPRNTGEVVRAYDKVLIPEINLGQLRMLIRAQFLVDAAGYNKLRGRPFRAAELADAITALVDS